MKLQAKFTFTFILLIVFTIALSFFLINWNVQTQFHHFIEERNKQIIIPMKLSGALIVKGSPEQRFSDTVTNSLIWAGIIDILLAVILAYFLSKLLLKRIYNLKDSMSLYMKDGTSKPVFHGNQDEVDELAYIYNLLIEKIKKEEKIRKDFFVDMSHELRTPLTSIKGYLEGLIDKVFDPAKEKNIYEKTLHETNRMIHLVKEMTTLAKLETEKTKLSTKQINLRKLTDEVIEMLKPSIEERNLKVTVEGNIAYNVDPYKFKQVLINLLQNAIHYAQSSSTIEIEMGIKEKKSYWKIKNKIDGLLPENIDYFFERFYRGDKSRTYDSKNPHLGIGLNIVKKIVEQHNGTISAETEDSDIIFEITLG